MLLAGHKRKRVQTKLFGDDYVREDLKPGRGPRRRKVRITVSEILALHVWQLHFQSGFWHCTSGSISLCDKYVLHDPVTPQPAVHSQQYTAAMHSLLSIWEDLFKGTMIG